MSKQYGFYLNLDRCVQCHACEVACKQEHDYPVGLGGITVSEFITESPDKLHVDYIPFPTRLCDLCAERTGRGESPACVKHCQAVCMMYGTIDELAKVMESKTRSVIFAPR